MQVIQATGSNLLHLPFVIYADFRSALRKKGSSEPSSSKSFSTQCQYHVPCGSCIYVKSSDGQYFEQPQKNVGMTLLKGFWTGRSQPQQPSVGNTCPTKPLWNGWPKNNGQNRTTPSTTQSAPNHSSQQIKKSATMITWQVNIEVQLTTNATWITTSIQKKWKFHASFTTSEIYCFYVMAIFIIASFWNSFW